MDPEVEEQEGEPEEQALSESELLANPLVEAPVAAAIVPKKGKLFDDDGAMKVAIIRPCISRGRRIRGLPPIYEASMLSRHAKVFEDWPMFMDHVPPEAAKALQKRGRSVTELGGRIVESWFEPEFTTEKDEEHGYKRGAVVGRAIPQPVPRKMLEADPMVMRTSINAYPTGAKPGTAYGRKGMMIEGIRKTPVGSVDWVVRAGAGGQPLVEDAEMLVSLVEAYYDDRQMGLEDFSAAQLREHIEQNHPELAEALGKGDGNGGAGRGASTISLSDVEGLLEKQRTELTDEFESKLEEREESITEELDEKRAADATARLYRTQAHALIEAAESIPPRWKTDLKARYDVTPSGPTPALATVEPVTEGDETKTAEQVLEGRVNDDLDHARELLREAQGKPAVRGEGPGKSDTRESKRSRSERTPLWRERFVEMGLAESADKAEEAFGAKVQEDE